MKKVAAPAFLLAMAIVHAIIASWTPLQGDDWGHWVWAGHGHSFLAAHYQFSEFAGFLLARALWVHTIVTPLVEVALIIGVFVLAMRRVPRATIEDALALALVSALFWIGGPRAGVVWFHRPFVAGDVYGLAIAVWLVAPLRCNWKVPRGLLPLVILGAYCVGTSTRTIATATLIGVVIAVRRRSRDAWQRVLLWALLVGTAVGYASPPWIEFPRVFKRGLDPNLVLLKLPMREGGEVILLVLAVVLADAVLGALGRARAPVDARPSAADALRWLWAWFAISVWALFGPQYSEATLLPATAALAVAAVPVLMWLARSRPLRYALVGFAIAVHAVAWTYGLRVYHRLGAEGAARLALLETGAPDTVVTVPPYSQIVPTFWFFGEDFGGAGPRQLVATEAFGLRDIDVSPEFRRYEPSPALAVKLEVDGATDTQVRAAEPPRVWATSPSAARYQFTRFAKRLRAAVPGARARLVVTDVAFERPLAIAQLEAGQILAPRVVRSSPDTNDRYAITVRGDVDMFDQAWLITGGTVARIAYDHGRSRIQPLVAAQNIVAICNPRACIVADAFTPQF